MLPSHVFNMEFGHRDTFKLNGRSNFLEDSWQPRRQPNLQRRYEPDLQSRYENSWQRRDQFRSQPDLQSRYENSWQRRDQSRSQPDLQRRYEPDLQRRYEPDLQCRYEPDMERRYENSWPRRRQRCRPSLLQAVMESLAVFNENQKRSKTSRIEFKENQKPSKTSTTELEKDRELLKENQKPSKTSTTELEKDRELLEKDRELLKENQTPSNTSTTELEKDRELLEKDRELLEKDRELLKENQTPSKTSTTELEKDRELLEKDRELLKENQTPSKTSTTELEKVLELLEKVRELSKTSTTELEKVRELSKTSTTELEKVRELLEENQKWDKQNQEGTPCLVKPHQEQIATESKPRPQTTKSWYTYLALIMTLSVCTCCGTMWNTALRVIGICFPKRNCRRHEGTPRLVKPRQGQIAPKYKPRPQTTTSWYQYLPVLMTVLFGLCCGAAGYTDCLTTQSVLLGSQGVIRCRLFENSTRFYWFDTNNGGDDTALIILENRGVRGTGYTSGEFNIDSDGSLIINSVTVEHERVFHLESLSPSLIRRTKDITVIVYVEPIEPIPVITECLSQPDCIMKGNLDRVISCVHHNTRPAATISWFMRDGTHDIPLNSTTNQTLSEDLITFSVTSEMAIGEIPFVVKMPSFVLLVCKSHNPYSVVQESDSKVLLDLSQNDPFEKQSNLPEGPVYAIQNQDLVIECPLPIAAEVSIVMWMAISLEAKNSGYLIYSAYGVVPSVETDEQYSLSTRGDLVISQVGLQHEGLYACVKSTGSTAKSVLQRVEVIVQPTPPKVLVEGCSIFEPCSFHITETKGITCKVNGVHPKMELKITALSTNLAVKNTKVSTYEDEGLCYTSIHGDVMLVDANCQVNGTIICQAVGPAANVFKSDAYISISSNGVKCPQISAAPFPADKEGQIKPWIIILLTIAVTLLCVFIALKVIGFAKLNCHGNMQAVPVKELDPV